MNTAEIKRPKAKESVMTQKDHEDRFIEQCRKNIGTLTWESEHLLRYGFAAGAQELGRVAYAHGIETQRTQVLEALGASPRKTSELP